MLLCQRGKLTFPFNNVLIKNREYVKRKHLNFWHTLGILIISTIIHYEIFIICCLLYSYKLPFLPKTKCWNKHEN